MTRWNQVYGLSAANALSPSELLSTHVFYPSPSAMFNATIDPDTQNRILSYAIPAISTSIGHERVGPEDEDDQVLQGNIDMNALNRPNGWWRPKSFGQLGERWLHSDMFEVAYCYVYEVFDDFATRGGLK